MVMTIFNNIKTSILILLLLGDSLAWGHATVTPKQVIQSSYQKLSFGISHGCEGTPTVEVIIYLPESIMGAKPMPKAGWMVETEIRDLTQPYMSHGKSITKDVRVIRWKGKLLDYHYDEFIFMSKIGDKTGIVAVPVTQICEKGRLDWSQLPESGGKQVEFPAPVINVMSGEHNH
jgi:periplasmic copper chaperone A